MKRDKIHVNDRQLACARITSTEGENYLKAMSAAANYAWVNRSSMTFLTRQVGRLHFRYLHSSPTSIPVSLPHFRHLQKLSTPLRMTWTCTSSMMFPTTSPKLKSMYPLKPPVHDNTWILLCMWCFDCIGCCSLTGVSSLMVGRGRCWCIARAPHEPFPPITP